MSPTFFRNADMTPGRDAMRALFEEACVACKVANFPLGTLEVNGTFSKFMDSDTDSAWLGFAMGYLACERRAQVPAMVRDIEDDIGILGVAAAVLASHGCNGSAQILREKIEAKRAILQAIKNYPYPARDGENE